MRRTAKIGLLPLYLRLYDDTMPGLREQFEPFLTTIVQAFLSRGVDVVRGDICRLEPEFQRVVGDFERQNVDLIVTLHLAYSPSLESAETLAATELPILMLDTTMDYDFGFGVDPARIMFDHGIHGVQDLASVLRRMGKRFEIVAGHVTESDVMMRAAGVARAALAARLLRTARVLRIGEVFRGMGDFAVSEIVMKDVLGVTVDEATIGDLESEVGEVSGEEIEQELQRDREAFTADVPAGVHERSVRVGLALRRLLDQRNCSAFSMNFLAFDGKSRLVETVPFLEASKAMARGMGYAGEGDTLTASLVGALNGAFGKTTFSEFFCPDWKGGSLFISHMGEVNPEVAAETPRLIEKDFPWTGAENPAIVTCAPATGPAVIVNLTPGPEDTFSLIVAPVDVLGDTTNPALRDSVRGWLRPRCPLEDFLEQYSRRGGTHHSALVLGDCADAIAAFGRHLAGIEAYRL